MVTFVIVVAALLGLWLLLPDNRTEKEKWHGPFR